MCWEPHGLQLFKVSVDPCKSGLTNGILGMVEYLLLTSVVIGSSDIITDMPSCSRINIFSIFIMVMVEICPE